MAARMIEILLLLAFVMVFSIFTEIDVFQCGVIILLVNIALHQVEKGDK